MFSEGKTCFAGLVLIEFSSKCQLNSRSNCIFPECCIHMRRTAKWNWKSLVGTGLGVAEAGVCWDSHHTAAPSSLPCARVEAMVTLAILAYFTAWTTGSKCWPRMSLKNAQLEDFKAKAKPSHSLAYCGLVNTTEMLEQRPLCPAGIRASRRPSLQPTNLCGKE